MSRCLSELGLKRALELDGNPRTLNATVPLKPFRQESHPVPKSEQKERFHWVKSERNTLKNRTLEGTCSTFRTGSKFILTSTLSAVKSAAHRPTYRDQGGQLSRDRKFPAGVLFLLFLIDSRQIHRRAALRNPNGYFR